MGHKYVYRFSEGRADMRELLGGKGANLAEMTNLGMPVPPGFTVSTEACTQYYKDNRTINADIQAQILEYLADLENTTGKKFGDETNPLLVSVRSGARASMPKGLLALQNLLFRVMPAENFRKMGLEKQSAIQLCASMAELDLRPVLEQVGCPALVLCGERDRANRRAAEELGRLLPRAELRLIAEGGHEANRDAPEALSVLLTGFYRRCAGAKTV